MATCTFHVNSVDWPLRISQVMKEEKLTDNALKYIFYLMNKRNNIYSLKCIFPYKKKSHHRCSWNLNIGTVATVDCGNTFVWDLECVCVVDWESKPIASQVDVPPTGIPFLTQCKINCLDIFVPSGTKGGYLWLRGGKTDVSAQL